jgi:hypothetical protein
MAKRPTSNRGTGVKEKALDASCKASSAATRLVPDSA